MSAPASPDTADAPAVEQRFRLAVGDSPLPDRVALAVQNPYRGDTAFWVDRATPADVDIAVRLGRREALAAPLPAHRRAAVLERAADLIDATADDLTDLLIREAGKPRRAASGEVARAAETFRWSAGEALRITGEAIPLDAAPSGEGRLAFTIREPVGVVAAITPTNAPLNLAAHKVGPALAAGNAVVLKPPNATPGTALALRDLLVQAGLPPAWFSVVVGSGLGQALVAHPGVDLVAFTGSEDTGRQIRAAAGIRDVMLELGGNSPVIIHDDADLDRAVSACTAKGFAGAGQACTSVQRIIAHRDVADDVAERLVRAVDQLVVGDPDDPATTVAALGDDAAADQVQAWVDEALDRGARRLVGGRRDGRIIWPTVLTDVPTDCQVWREEVFGPVVVLAAADDLDHAIALADDTPYGLHAAIFTESLDVAFTAIRRIHAGAVLVNEATQWRTEFVPFGGTKASGTAREGPRYAIQQMTRPKLAVLALEAR